MKELFTDLYKKVAGFFQAAEEKENVKEVACNRLKFVLMQDRTNLNPQLLERMRSEMIDLLSKYVEMDKEALELSFEQEGESLALMLSIPVIRAKDEEEIQALIKAEEEAKAKIKAEEEAAEEENSETEEEIDEAVDEDAEEQTEETDEEVCACGEEDEEIEEISESPDEIEVEEISTKKSKKNKN